ncbi:hypothetical protein NEOLEDRAFT_1182397 [Neolentinus lepideus HHB14362 ss-1]|uniref:MARVEL domain-containing protein n=1 Tax=Neolentinus lepideus HHB14362 ss-1 TaxID=1314782 RepID=A0A165P8C0_9AGAM|nr:hypothetical protein NEOLEDRAFT_1182397 [Neolentinus lepideus HHB14362 ss-1]
MPFLPILRLVVFVATLVFAVITLGVAADLLNLTETYFSDYLIFCVLAVVSASLTIITLPIMIVLDIVRQGAFTSTVVFELSWLFVLWVLWLATAADTTNANSLSFGGSCDYINPYINRGCQEFNVVEAFSYLIWIILMGYTITLLVLAIIGQTRGNEVWLTSVRDNAFLRRSAPGDRPVLEEKYPPTAAPAPTQSQYHTPSPGAQTFHAQHPSNLGSYQGSPSPLQPGVGMPHGGQNAYGQV